MMNKKGLGLGSQLCQLLALLYLDELDHYIKEELGVDVYVRYNDDFVIVCPELDQVKDAYRKIDAKVRKNGLKLNNKTSIHPLKQGIMFLQWKFCLKETGKVLMFMKHSKVTKYRRRLRKLWQKEQQGLVRKGTTKESLRCFLANASMGNTDRIRRNVIRYYTELTGERYNLRR